MRNTSISTCFDYFIPIDRQLPIIRSAGFRCISIGGNYEHSGILDGHRLARLKRLVAENDLSVDTIHGYAMDKPDTLEINQKIVDAAVVLGAPVVVLHCSAFAFRAETLEDRKRDLMDKFPAFVQMARTANIKFALENVLPGVATDLVEFAVRRADPLYFGFCYDSSHDQIDGPRPFDLLERLHDRLIAVHISDRIREQVDHVLPGEGFVDFDMLADVLKKSDVDFPLLMEVMTTHSAYKEPIAFLTAAYLKAVELLDRVC